MTAEDVLYHGALVAVSTMFGYTFTDNVIPIVANHFITKTRLHGIDMGKKDKTKIPESLGIVVGLTYLASLMLFFITAPHILVNLSLLNSLSLSDKICTSTHSDESNGYSNSLSYMAAITSILAMLMLGFIDDCYDLRWRYKLMFPFAASVPLLGVYYYSYRDRTTVLVPQILANYLDLDDSLNLGTFYYIFMLMFVIFCTNAINIYAGINGLEVGQTLVLTVTIILYNVFEITTKSDCDEVHVLSLQLLLPFLFCSCALYKYNRYPAKVFVGDSYCYFAGMTIAVVGILGHFSEEILLFAAPQVFNFVLSIPQLFKIVPCPRHRLPKFNETTGLREPSTFEFRYDELNILGKMIMKIYTAIGVAKLTAIEQPAKEKYDSCVPPVDSGIEENKGCGSSSNESLGDERLACIQDGGQPLAVVQQVAAKQENQSQLYTSNNLTLINLWLCWFGPKDERTLCHQLIRFQCCLSLLALAILTFVGMKHE